MPIAFHLFSLIFACSQKSSDTSSKDTNGTTDTASMDFQALNEAYEAELLKDRNFLPFGETRNGLRLNAGSFIAEIDQDGAHFRHSRKGGEVNIELAAWGRIDNLQPTTSKKPLKGDCFFDHPKRGCIQQGEVSYGAKVDGWWRGDRNAIEQGWTINSEPEGSGHLAFNVHFDGGTIRTLDMDQAIILDSKRTPWTYDGVKAWDANRQPLDAWLEEAEEGLLVVVDAEDAQYPVTVDPWFSVAGTVIENTVSHSGQVTGVAPTYDITGESAACSYGDFISPYNSGEVGSRGWWQYYLSGTSNPDVQSLFQDEIYSYRCAEVGYYGRATNFSSAIERLGDSNGDGTEDLIVAAKGWSLSHLNSDMRTGKVFVYLGDAQQPQLNIVFGDGSGNGGIPNNVQGDPQPTLTIESNGNSIQIRLYNSNLGYSADGSTDVEVDLADGNGGDKDTQTIVDDIIAQMEVHSDFGNSANFVYSSTADGADTTLTITAPAFYQYTYDFTEAYLGGDDIPYIVATQTDFSTGLLEDPDFWLSGENSEDHFGQRILTEQDINGDGYNDVVIAAPQHDATASNAGRLYVYHGTANGLSQTPAVTIDGISEDDYIGEMMEWAGDVNGDGYADVIVGCKRNDVAYTDAGKVYLYFGSANSLSTTPDRIWTGEAADDQFGTDVVGIGDFNGDGYDDVAMSAPNNDDNGSQAGKVYVYFGSANGPGPAADQVRYGSPGSQMSALQKVGDINGDGYAELRIGSQVWEGSSIGLSGNPDYSTGIDRYLGDVNNDGRDDAMISGAMCYGQTSGGYNCDYAVSGADTISDIDGDGFYDYVNADAGWNGSRGRFLVNYAYESDEDQDGYMASEDCNDNDATVYPGAPEIPADGVDNDCDGTVMCFTDADDDGYRDASESTILSLDDDCDDLGEAEATMPATDCDDNNPLAHPGGIELPGDGVDQDCDGGDSCYADIDGDGFRSTEGTTIASRDLDCDDPGEVSFNVPATDCDDFNANIYPGAPEIPANGVDDDCNGNELCYVDNDNDNYREPTGLTMISNDLDCSDAGEGMQNEPPTDCDDNDPNFNPGAVEIINDGIDQDCDGGDECFVDADDDGFRTDEMVLSDDGDCDDPGEAYDYEPNGDCDDNNASVNPDATEILGDGIDSDCDGTENCFADVDMDGYLDASGAMVPSLDGDCDDPGEGNSTMPATDCNDNDANINPSATEIPADGIDQDCDGTETCYVDGDGDGLLPSNPNTMVSSDGDCNDTGEADSSTLGQDCDDNDSSVYTGATEIPADGIDQDCDTFDSCPVDADGDGHLGDGFEPDDGTGCDQNLLSLPTGDCDDNDPTVNAGATESINDGIDSDCDGQELCYSDLDGDGFRSSLTQLSADLDCDDANEANASQPEDCNDLDATVYAGSTEIIGDEIDQDCDGIEICYVDADGDGSRDPNNSTIDSTDNLTCSDAGEAAASYPVDCDDSDATINAGNQEVIDDGADQDCDGGDLCYADADGDGFADASGATVVSDDLDCDDFGEAGANAVMTDCDDSNADVYSGATEIPGDGIDSDCDGQELCYVDADQDGFRTETTQASSDLTCTTTGLAPAAAPIGDCDDSDASIHPDAMEIIADGMDSDCDGEEICYIDADQDGFRLEETTNSTDVTCSSTGLALESTPTGDCDDSDATIYTGAAETTGDGIDSDCDMQELCYVDADQDGFANSDGSSILSANLACDGPGEADNTVAQTDCDDSNATIYVGATENVDDGVDSDCDTQELCYVDADQDGHREMAWNTVASADLDCNDAGEATATQVQDDCNDNDATIYTGATETAGDGIDSDCDAQELCYVDADQDGFASSNGATVLSNNLACDGLGEADNTVAQTDCNDSNSTIYVGAPENIDDGVDSDCDTQELCYVDADQDGHREMAWNTVASADLDCNDAGEATATQVQDDCNDNDVSIYTGAFEITADNIDQNCDGLEQCFADADQDGFRPLIATYVISTDLDCDDLGEANIDTPQTDCNDTNANIHPDATEGLDDGIDQNCDGQELCLVDADDDGFRANSESTVMSEDMDCLDSGEAQQADPVGDCDDSSNLISPNATEIIGDGIDQNCDTLETCYVDADGDGYRTLETIQSTDEDCDDAGEAGLDLPILDCDDSAANIYPDADEVGGDGVDQNCDGVDAIAEEEVDPTPEEETKEGCSTVSTSSLSWFALLGIMLGIRRRR